MLRTFKQFPFWFLGIGAEVLEEIFKAFCADPRKLMTSFFDDPQVAGATTSIRSKD